MKNEDSYKLNVLMYLYDFNFGIFSFMINFYFKFFFVGVFLCSRIFFSYSRNVKDDRRNVF